MTATDLFFGVEVDSCLTAVFIKGLWNLENILVLFVRSGKTDKRAEVTEGRGLFAANSTRTERDRRSMEAVLHKKNQSDDGRPYTETLAFYVHT